jgi:glycosyltransferase involved in cell wall biosynthesis
MLAAMPPSPALPLRVAQIIAGAREGGAELFYERLCIALHRAGEAVLPVIRRDAARAARLREVGLPPVELGFGNPFDLLTGPRLAATLRRFSPRVAVAWMSRAAQFAPRGDWVLCGRLGGYYDLNNFRRCDHLIGNTHALVDWMTRQGWPTGRAHYLPNFTADMGGAAPISRADLDVPEQARLLLGLGRLHRNKAFDVLIRALPRLPDVHAVIAGEGPERQALQALAQAEGVADRVRLPGWRSDIAALLAAADLFVCSSRQEPLGNMVIEAWSARRPVVAASVGGPAELIEAGRSGWLVPPDDAAALAEAIAQAFGNPGQAAALAEAGRARYEADFAESPVLSQWRAFLASVEKA